MRGATIDEAGSEFLKELLRQHFGCDRSEHIPLLGTTSGDTSELKPLDTVGELFVADVLRHFHNDGSFLEVN